MEYQFDPRRLPWSFPGSQLAISERPRSSDSYRPAGDEPDEALYLRTVSEASAIPEIFALELATDWGGVHPPPETAIAAEATPCQLTLRTAGGKAELCFLDPDRLLVRGTGSVLRLALREWRPFDHVLMIDERTLILHAYKNRLRTRIRLERGTLRVDAPWERVRSPHAIVGFEADDSGEFIASLEFSSDDFPHEVPAIPEFNAAVSAAAERWDTWLDRHGRNSERITVAAAYINQSAIVGPTGILSRPIMYMSKFKMTKCWGWDHCFNAIAYARRDPDLAWDQFISFFEHANPNGMLPGSITDGLHNWIPKPPVHGWTFDLLLDMNQEFFSAKIDEVLGPLARWTDWWLAHRDYNGDGCPQYDHGNDSGWDNASSFDNGPGVDSPDLTAFLAYQARTVARLAGRSEQDAVETQYNLLADRLERLLVERFWTGTQFRGRQMQTGSWVPGDSLLNFMPVMLADRLPGEAQASISRALDDRTRFRTEWGLATESIGSSYYDPAGYWRGPIWAPSTLIAIDGLRRMGYSVQAESLAADFCRLVEKSGFAENFDAQNGTPLRDPTYTWTSSTYLHLRDSYVRGASE